MALGRQSGEHWVIGRIDAELTIDWLFTSKGGHM